MRIVDSHFHWWPRAVFEELCKRETFPRAEPNERGGYTYWFRENAATAKFNLGPEWYDLDRLIAHMDGTGRDFDLVCSTGPFSIHFSELPAAEGRDAAYHWNEELARAQAEHAGRLWGTAVVPLQDAKLAIEVLDHAITKLGLIGVNVGGSVGQTGNIDDPALEPFYDRVEELGIPIFLHPTDGKFVEIMDGYNGALYNSLGRIVDVSAAGMRLVLSGIMERHPNLKVYMSHTGGALAYQAGRMDKNARVPDLPEPPSTYLRRMYTDTVSPHSMGVQFAIDFYGADQVMYGDDYPCWTPEHALEVFEAIPMDAEVRQKIFADNARAFLGLPQPDRAPAGAAAAR